MFDAKYVQKLKEHPKQVNEAINAINYLLSNNTELMELNVKVKRISDAELLYVEREWETKSERKVGWRQNSA